MGACVCSPNVAKGSTQGSRKHQSYVPGIPPAMRTAITQTVTFVSPATMDGTTEATATRSAAMPRDRQSESTGAPRVSPMAAVPTGWRTVVARDQTASRTASSGAPSRPDPGRVSGAMAPATGGSGHRSPCLLGSSRAARQSVAAKGGTCKTLLDQEPGPAQGTDPGPSSDVRTSCAD